MKSNQDDPRWLFLDLPVELHENVLQENICVFPRYLHLKPITSLYSYFSPRLTR